jgi:hypothetical protein
MMTSYLLLLVLDQHGPYPVPTSRFPRAALYACSLSASQNIQHTGSPPLRQTNALKIQFACYTFEPGYGVGNVNLDVLAHTIY